MLLSTPKPHGYARERLSKKLIKGSAKILCKRYLAGSCLNILERGFNFGVQRLRAFLIPRGLATGLFIHSSIVWFLAHVYDLFTVHNRAWLLVQFCGTTSNQLGI